MSPSWSVPHLKMKPPHPKNNPPPPLKHETPFHEIIPRKSTINNKLKSSSNPWKVCLKKFIFSKFGGLQTYSQQLYYQMNFFTGIFRQHFKLPLPHQILRSPPANGEGHSPPCSQRLWETLYWEVVLCKWFLYTSVHIVEIATKCFSM